jgi:hypothetical protein
MAELGDFEKFLIVGLVGLFMLLAVFSGAFGFAGYGQDRLSSYYTGSPIFVGAADFDNVETLYASFDANNFIATNAYSLGARRISSGLLFGSNPVRVDVGNSEQITVSFDVTTTNRYGDLLVRVDGNVVFRGLLDEGHYELQLGSGRIVEIEAQSSEWRVWAPAVYDLENAVITSSSYPREKTTYTFEVADPREIQSVRIDFFMDSNAGGMLVKLNGDVVYDGAVNQQQSVFLDPSKLDEVNILTFDAREDSKFSGRATIAVTRKTWSQKDFVMDINMTDAEYAGFLRGTISFDVVDIFRHGGYSVTIVSKDGFVLLQEYAKLEKGYFVINVEKKNLNPGLNTLIIRPADNAAFTIQGVLTRL